jgi:hypothetical protein
MKAHRLARRRARAKARWIWWIRQQAITLGLLQHDINVGVSLHYFQPPGAESSYLLCLHFCGGRTCTARSLLSAGPGELPRREVPLIHRASEVDEVVVVATVHGRAARTKAARRRQRGWCGRELDSKHHGDPTWSCGCVVEHLTWNELEREEG